jgi:outer membrane receptor protein involved in Fe transport
VCKTTHYILAVSAIVTALIAAGPAALCAQAPAGNDSYPTAATMAYPLPGTYPAAASEITLAESPGDFSSGATYDYKYDDGIPLMGELVVSATRSRGRLENIPASIATIKSIDLTNDGISYLAEALPRAPGVTVNQTNPGGYDMTVSIRGSSDFKIGSVNNRVLVFVDNRPVNQPDQGTVNWNMIPAEDIERVEVLRGPASAIYGSAAVGGVINVITKTGRSDHVNRAKVRYGTFNTVDLFLSGGGTVGDADGYVSARRKQSSGYRSNGDYRSTGVFGKGEYDFNPGGILGVASGYSISRGGNPGFVGSSKAGRSRRYNRSECFAQAFYDLGRVETRQYNLNLFHAGYKYSVSDPDGGNRNRYDSSLTGGTFTFDHKPWHWFRYLVGLDSKYATSESSVFIDVDEAYFFSRDFAHYMQLEFEPFDWLIFSGGARYDENEISTGQKFASISPKVGLIIKPTSSTRLRGSFSRGFRVPTIGELYIKYESSFGLTFQGNPELKPEKIVAYEMGINQDIGHTGNLDLVYFTNFYKEIIEFRYSLPVVSNNLDGARVRGFELSLQWRALGWLRLHLQGTALDTALYHQGRVGPLLYRPKLNANAGVGVYDHNRWYVGFDLVYVGARPYEDFLAPVAEHTMRDGIIVFPRKELPDYLIARLVGRWWIAEWLGLSSSANNLFNDQYDLVQDFPAPPITFNVGLEARY